MVVQELLRRIALSLLLCLLFTLRVDAYSPLPMLLLRLIQLRGGLAMLFLQALLFFA